jgi:pyridoxine 5-phosphate synthase
MSAHRLRLGVNVDHVATIRNARGGRHPDPVRAAKLAIAAGCDGITAHLREDRRHIRDDDIARLKAEIDKPLNFEMAATDEMVRIALDTKPHAVCLVPEKRTERTTEGGLDAVRQRAQLQPVVHTLKHAGIRVSLFIGAAQAQIEAAAELGAPSLALPSGAGHDAMVLARYLPSAMMFIPSIGGRSHHISEDTSEADIVLGAQVLLRAVALLMQNPGRLSAP